MTKKDKAANSVMNTIASISLYVLDEEKAALSADENATTTSVTLLRGEEPSGEVGFHAPAAYRRKKPRSEPLVSFQNSLLVIFRMEMKACQEFFTSLN